MRELSECKAEIFSRSEKRIKQRKIKFKKVITGVSCFCLVAILGIVSRQAGLFKAKPEQIPSNAVNPSIEDKNVSGEEQTVENEMQDIDPDRFTVRDMYGMIIYNGVTYNQDTTITEKDGLELDKKLGNGEEFDGTYNPKWIEKQCNIVVKPDGIKAEVFSVKDRNDMLCVKLSNGATIYLRADSAY